MIWHVREHDSWIQFNFDIQIYEDDVGILKLIKKALSTISFKNQAVRIRNLKIISKSEKNQIQ